MHRNSEQFLPLPITKSRRLVDMWFFFMTLALAFTLVSGCQFYPAGDYLRFLRVTEDTRVGETVLVVDVHPRHNLTIQPVDRIDDASYFGHRDINRTTVGVVLLKSLDDLVDNENPQNVLKFRMVCDYNTGPDTISSYMSVTVYVEDVNDHAPRFLNVPYHVTVDELTPVGLTLFRGIHAIDRDKPNTPNSDVHYSIVGGNEDGRFALESSHRAVLVLKKPLDYDQGGKEYVLRIMASDRGSPPRNSTTPLFVRVSDNDDLSPQFTRDIYRTHISEFYPITGVPIHKELRFKPPIAAYDADTEINSPVRYDIVSGNEKGYFSMNPNNGSLFLEREVDLEKERSLPGNTFVLHVQASQLDNPLKMGFARVEVKVLDINDNLPEFEVDLYNISIVENLPNGFSVLQVVAADRDQGENGEFTFQLDDDSGAFRIDPKSGWLTVGDQSVLDREKQSALSMRVYAREKVPNVIRDRNRNSKTAFVSVEVTLLDANDNNPTFVPSNLYEFRIPGDARVGDLVGQVKAIDPDQGRNGHILYNLQRSNTSSLNGGLASFVVDAHSGHILVNEHPLAQGRYALFVEAADQPANPSEKRFSLAVVTVEVLKTGKNELIPDFIGAPYEFWVGGDVPVGTSVGQIRVTDALDKDDVVFDLLHSYHEGVPFAVEEKSGVITVVNELKKFDRSLYDFEALVTDERDVTIVTNMTIHVVDAEEYKQPIIRENSGPIELRVRENLAGALVGQIVRPYESPYSNTSAWWKSLRFVIANQPDVADKFAISFDGTIYTAKGLDREERDIYRLTIIVENTKKSRQGAKVYQVTVIVEDENDNPPEFEYSQYEGHIPENSPGGTEVSLDHHVRARDADLGFNSQFKYTLYGEGSDIFVIDQATGRIFLKKSAPYLLDREEKQVYMLRVVARDKGNLNSEVKLNVHVDDVNDNPPRFLQMVVLHDEDVEIIDRENKLKRDNSASDIALESYHSDSELSASSPKNAFQLPPLISLSENIPVGTSIIRLLADDKDANSSITYRIIKEVFIPPSDREENLTNKKHFAVHSSGGEIAVATRLSPETEYRLVVSASDGGGFSDNVTVRVYVKDVNDHPPVFSESSYDFDLLEGEYSEQFVGRVEAADADYGDNANVSYSIDGRQGGEGDVEFRISPLGGEIYVSGTVDRESRGSYSLRVVATDGSKGQRLSSGVQVEVHVTDVNDNAPTFHDYDRLLEIPRYQLEDWESDILGDEQSAVVPVYYTSVQENSALGVPIIKISANDSDFAGNGNGLFLFDIIRRKNLPTFFEIDSKEGVVTITNQLDYEHLPIHNVTIRASDLGKPSLSSTALLVVNVVDIPEEDEDIRRPMFDHRYYEIEVEENALVPLELLTVNVSDSFRQKNLKYSLVPGHDSSSFAINSRNGSLLLIAKPDREAKVRYEIKVRVDRIKRGKGMATFIYPPPDEKVADLESNEVKIVVKVKDVNDNSPRFSHYNRPIVAAVPKSASYGHDIIRLQATDADEGLNGEIRYQILGRRDDDSSKFSIDPQSGQVRSVASFAKDAGKVFGFDVKATDRRGADNGRSAIANVFVYILDDEKQVIMVVRSKPAVVERNVDLITNTLSNVTGLEVRARKIEPHIRSDQDDGKSTDLYLYAVNPSMNVLVDMESFHQVLEAKRAEIKENLDSFRILDFAYVDEPLPPRPRAQRSILSALEVAVVVLGCAVFIGAVASAVCVSCVERGRKRKRKSYPSPNVGFTLGKAIMKPSHVLPASVFRDGLCQGDTTDTYVDLHSSQSGTHDPKRRLRHNPSCHRHPRHRLERQSSQCKTHLVRSNSNFGRLEASLTSLHSSGKDSGIAEGRGGVCTCGHSTSHSSGDSTNGSYEDSLKSFQRREEANLQQMMSARRASMCGRPRRRPSPPGGVPPPPPALPRTLIAPIVPRALPVRNERQSQRPSPVGQLMEFLNGFVMQSEGGHADHLDHSLTDSPATDTLRHHRPFHDYSWDSLNSNLVGVVPASNSSEGSHMNWENLSDAFSNSSLRNHSEVQDYFYRHSPALTIVYCVAYFLVFVVGLVGNCLVVAVVFRAPRMRTVTNLFIVNLAIADILVVVLCIPATLLGNIFVPWVLGWWMCKTVPYVQGVSVAASVYSLIAVSLDRFLAIWWPLKCQITKRRARVIIVVIWVVACTTTIPWALYFDLVIFSEAPHVLLCLEVWPESLSGSLYFLVVNLVFCYILPLILISLCYILIWIKVWRRTIPTDTKDLHMEKMQQKSKVKVVKMLVVVVIIFVVSWMPLYIIFARIKLGGDFNHWEENLLAYMTPVAQWMGSSNSCINPILYAFFNKKYRRGFVAIIKSKKCCGRLRYYETVAMMGSSSSMRNKSSYYINNNNNNNSSTRKPPSQDTSVSYIFNNFGV